MGAIYSRRRGDGRGGGEFMTHPCPKCAELERRLKAAREALELIARYSSNGTEDGAEKYGHIPTEIIQIGLAVNNILRQIDAPYMEGDMTFASSSGVKQEAMGISASEKVDDLPPSTILLNPDMPSQQQLLEC